jgi:outer membrane lipoprotein-sorting protein
LNVERALVLLAAPLVACGGVSYVEAPTTLAPAPTASASASASESLRTDADAAAPSPAPVPATLVVTPPASPAPTPLSAAAVSTAIARTASFYSAAGPFACDLDEETVRPFPKGGPSSRTRLHLTFERPGKLHIAFSTGAVLVVNAGMLYLTDPSSQQRMQTPVAADYVPLAFAYAGSSLASRAAFTGYPGSVVNMPSYELLVGPPAAPASGVQKILFFDAASGEVRRTLLVADKGVRQRLDVVQCTMHVTPAPSLFATPTGPSTVTTTTTAIASSPLLGVP